MIQLQNISKSFGEQILLKDTGFLVGPRERIGLVGRNGSGKSTLFKMILGEEDSDGGYVLIPKNYSFGYLTQHLHFTHPTVREEASSALKENEDGWKETHKIEAILFGLGFDEDALDKSPALLSGGFQIRLNLAKVLAAEPSMLLLDEPTNYLDIISTRWLARFLRQWKGELILITHDRKFMNSVCTHTVGIYQQKLRKIQGSVQKLYQTLAEEEEIILRTQQNDAKKREQLEKIIERFRYKASKASMVQSKIKAAAKLSSDTERIRESKLDFEFTEAPFPGKRMLQIKELSFYYNPEQVLIPELSLEIFKGDRIAIIGPNGRGKTTLLNLIAGELTPVAGFIEHNPNLELNYFGQTNINRLNMENSVEEEIQLAVKDVSRGKARNLAGVMMFSGDSALKKIRVLSGGERSRVLLAKILATPCNFLLLDEPTNHLDMESIESLIEALYEYQGAAMVVTHDEDLLHAFANRLIIFDNGKCFSFEGTYQDFLDRIGWYNEKNEQASAISNRAVTEEKPAATDKESRRDRAAYIETRSKIIKPLEKEAETLEKNIQTLEKESGLLENQLIQASETGDSNLITEVSKKIAATQKQIEAAYEKWETVNSRLEEAKEKYPL